jgi:nucleoside-diphosphate kinase
LQKVTHPITYGAPLESFGGPVPKRGVIIGRPISGAGKSLGDALAWDAAGATQQEALARGSRSIKWPAVAVERSLILTNPDAAHGHLAAEILGRIEAGGLEIREAKLVTGSGQVGEEQYSEHREKPLSSELGEIITSGPTWVLVVEGKGAIATLRSTMGATERANVAPATVLGDLGSSMPDNLGHGPGSPESAQREVALWSGG